MSFKFIELQLSMPKTQELGLWKQSEHECANCINLQELDAEQEFFILENKCTFDCFLEGWEVKDAGRNTFKLSEIPAQHQQKILSGKNVWNNDGDDFFLRDAEGLLVIYYNY